MTQKEIDTIRTQRDELLRVCKALLVDLREAERGVEAYRGSGNPDLATMPKSFDDATAVIARCEASK